MHLIPKIQELLHKQNGYCYVTLLDLSDKYYSFVIHPDSLHLLTTVTPFGLFCYKRMQQGSLDITQEAMENLL